MDTLKTAAAGLVAGTLIGRLLGIGPVGTVLGAFAGLSAGVLLAAAESPRPGD